MDGKLNLDQKKVQEIIISCFNKKGQAYSRKELINKALTQFEMTAAERKDTRPDSKLNRTKSNIGSVISKMQNDGDLMQDEAYRYLLTKDARVLIDENEVETFVVTLLGKVSKRTKGQIVSEAREYLKTDRTSTVIDDVELSGVVKTVLSKLIKQKAVYFKYGNYSLYKEKGFPPTPIGQCVKKSHAEGNDPGKSLIEAINILGGEFFEIFSVKLLEKYFAVNNYTIVSSAVTGGANDNGIDGKIEVVDDLGYREHVFIQAKVRAKNQISLNEVRQFLGAVTGEKGTRGIFITNGVFHSEAGKYIKKLDNIVGIDKRKLIRLATTYKVGVEEKNGKTFLSDKVFIKNEW